MPLNPHLAALLGDAFGSERDADCTVLFVVEEPADEAAGETRGGARGNGGNGEQASASKPALSPHAGSKRSGASLPARRCVLFVAVEDVRAEAREDGAAAAAEPAPSPQTGAKRPGSPLQADEAASSRQARKVERVVGAPLPGHTFVLRNTSDLFRAQIERWQTDRASGSAEATSSSSGRLELRVPLNSADDEPAARAALKFAYTGQVEPTGSVREVLQLRRQAGLLSIDGGPAKACDELLAAKLREADGSGTAAAGSSSNSAAPPVLELFAAADLFPDAENDPTSASFANIVLVAARQAMAAHFRDTVHCLNTPSLIHQLQQLPAVALEALLASDNFGTDTEDSVLLLLATWMKANFSSTDATARQRLSKLVRLVQLTGPTLAAVLPALAADYTAGCTLQTARPKRRVKQGEWLPIPSNEAAFIVEVARASGDVRDALLAAATSVHDLQSPRYSFTCRPQCVPADGTSFAWSVSRAQLEEELRELKLDEECSVFGAFEGGAEFVHARGVAWQPRIQYTHGAMHAGVHLDAEKPAAYKVNGSSVHDERVVSVAGIDARLVVHKWDANGARQDAFHHQYDSSDHPIQLGCGLGWHDALPLAAEAAAPPAGAAAAAGAAAPDPLAAWAAYLGPDGRITGTLTLLPPAYTDGDDEGEPSAEEEEV